MLAAKWISKAQGAGWRVAGARDRQLHLTCSHQGCAGSLTLPIDNLGAPPAPCDLPHHGQYGQATFDQYRDLVNDLRRRRRALGLSQEDLNAAAGLTDGHINKLEAFARVAQFPTLQLWASTLGAQITLAPSPIPTATARAIERRPVPLRETPAQKAMFDE